MTPPAHNPTLREQLDAVRPDSDDLRDPDLEPVARAVEESDQWRNLFERQQAFDREVAAVIQDVDVPDGLMPRLLESLIVARQDSATHITPDAPPAPVRRRRLLTWAATVCGLLLAVALGWLFWAPDASLITLEQARHQLPTDADRQIDITGLGSFDNSFAFELPDAEWRRRTTIVADLKGLDWTGDGRHDGAVYEFQIRGRIHGYLLVLPASRLSDLPAATRLSLSDVDYQPVTNTAWVESSTGLVYICFVDTGDLRELHDALYPHTA